MRLLTSCAVAFFLVSPAWAQVPPDIEARSRQLLVQGLPDPAVKGSAWMARVKPLLEAGNSTAHLAHGLHLALRAGQPAEGLALVRKAAALGNPQAMAILAQSLLGLPGAPLKVPKNRVEGAGWWNHLQAFPAEPRLQAELLAAQPTLEATLTDTDRAALATWTPPVADQALGQRALSSGDPCVMVVVALNRMEALEQEKDTEGPVHRQVKDLLWAAAQTDYLPAEVIYLQTFSRDLVGNPARLAHLSQALESAAARGSLHAGLALARHRFLHRTQASVDGWTSAQLRRLAEAGVPEGMLLRGLQLIQGASGSDEEQAKQLMEGSRWLGSAQERAPAFRPVIYRAFGEAYARMQALGVYLSMVSEAADLAWGSHERNLPRWPARLGQRP